MEKKSAFNTYYKCFSEKSCLFYDEKRRHFYLNKMDFLLEPAYTR